MSLTPEQAAAIQRAQDRLNSQTSGLTPEQSAAIQRAHARLTQQPTEDDVSPTKQSYTFPQMMNTARKNIVPSLYDAGEGILKAPITLGKLAMHPSQIPDAGKQILNSLIERHGGSSLSEVYDANKRTFAEDPVGFLMDVAPAIEGVGAVTKVGGLSKAGRMLDPLTPVSALASKVAPPIGSAIWNALSPKTRILQQAVGDKIPQVINALKSAESPIPGMELTGRQALSDTVLPQLHAIAKGAEKYNPVPYMQRKLDQTRQIGDYLQSIGGTPEDIARAVGERASVTQPLYDMASKVKSKLDPTFQDLMNRPIMQQVAKEADTLSRNSGNTGIFLDKLNNLSGEGLDLIKKGFDSLIQSKVDPNGNALTKAKLNSLMATKKEFMNWAENSNPFYKEANSKFSEMSKPVNQMNVVNYLKDTLQNVVDPSTGRMKPTSFMNALKSPADTIEAATGLTGIKDFSKILTPEQMKALDDVGNFLKMNNRTKQLESGVSGLKSDLTGDIIKTPHIFNSTAYLVHWLSDQIQKFGNAGAMKAIAEGMISPENAAALFTNVGKRTQKGRKIGKAITAGGNALKNTQRLNPFIQNLQVGQPYNDESL